MDNNVIEEFNYWDSIREHRDVLLNTFQSNRDIEGNLTDDGMRDMIHLFGEIDEKDRALVFLAFTTYLDSMNIPYNNMMFRPDLYGIDVELQR